MNIIKLLSLNRFKNKQTPMIGFLFFVGLFLLIINEVSLTYYSQYFPNSLSDWYNNHMDYWRMSDAILEGNILKFLSNPHYSMMTSLVFLIFYFPVFLTQSKIAMFSVPLLINLFCLFLTLLILLKYFFKNDRLMIGLMMLFLIIPTHIFLFSVHPRYLVSMALASMFYFLLKDNFNYKNKFLVALICLGVSSSFKMTAAIYVIIPSVFLLYSLYCKHISLYEFFKKNILCLVSPIIGIIIGNPYILHPVGWHYKMNFFLKVGYIQNSLYGKGIIGMDYLYSLFPMNRSVDGIFNTLFFAIIIFYSYFFFRQLKRKAVSKYDMFCIAHIIVIAVFIVLIKGGNFVYIYMSILSIYICFFRVFSNYRKKVCIMILLFCLSLKVGQASHVIYAHFQSNEQNKSRYISDSSFITNAINIDNDQTNHILTNIPFNFAALGLTYKDINIDVMAGLAEWMINEEKYYDRYSFQKKYKIKIFHPRTYIILDKNNIKNDESETIYNGLITGQYPYEQIAENESVSIFKLMDHKNK